MRIIRGKYGRRRFDVPTNISARPTTDFARENIFNVIENYIDLEGATALDLFAGTGAVSFELLSRGCSSVTSVERAVTQQKFISRVSKELGCDNHSLIRGDALRFIASATISYDLIFADPPYDMAGFADIPAAILGSRLVHPGTMVIIEHNKKHDFSLLAGFREHRAYGSVNFSIFIVPGTDDSVENE